MKKITLSSVFRAILGIALTVFILYMLYDLAMKDGKIFMNIISFIKYIINQIIRGLTWIKNILSPFSFNPQSTQS